MEWKPDLDTLKSWGRQDTWPDRYLEWLRTKNPLPELPSGSLEDQPRSLQPLWRVLTMVLDSEEETIEKFYNGAFATVKEMERDRVNVHYDRKEREAEAIVRKYRDVAEEMLRYDGPVDEAVIDMFLERLEAARRYYGPMA